MQRTPTAARSSRRSASLALARLRRARRRAGRRGRSVEDEADRRGVRSHARSRSGKEPSTTARRRRTRILPETNEIIWGAVGFLVVFGFLAWKGYPAIKKGMNARTERIRGDLDAAEAQRTEADEVLAEYQAQLADARTEAARIIEEARQAADEVKADAAVAKAEADVAELRAKAAADIEAAKAQAIADLRGEVASLAIGAAEQVVGAQPRPRHQRRPRRDLHRPGRDEQLMADDRTKAYAEALFAVARAEGDLGEIEDELFRVAQVLRGQRRAA